MWGRPSERIPHATAGGIANERNRRADSSSRPYPIAAVVNRGAYLNRRSFDSNGHVAGRAHSTRTDSIPNGTDRDVLGDKICISGSETGESAAE